MLKFVKLFGCMVVRQSLMLTCVLDLISKIPKKQIVSMQRLKISSKLMLS